MASVTAIEWSDATWNPITGCTRVSRGCGRCYAERLAATRLRDHPSRRGLTDPHGRWTGEVRFNGQWLDQPLRWKRPRRIFVCAHGDLFHEAVPYAWIDRVFGVMGRAPEHTFQVLTKRPERARLYLTGSSVERVRRSCNDWFELQGMPHRRWPFPNVLLGTSVEDQPTADERIAALLKVPAAVRWISAEPLLGPIDLNILTCNGTVFRRIEAARSLGWVVVGGESGPGARPMDPDWVRSLRDQCEAAGAPFFFKQWGGPTARAGGRLLDGRTWDGMPGEARRKGNAAPRPPQAPGGARLGAGGLREGSG